MNIAPVTDVPSPQGYGVQQHPSLKHYNSLPSSLETQTSSFWHRFSIPTKNDSLSSGFPYHPRLFDLKVSMDEWHLFTSDILNAGKMTVQEDYAAWSTGIVTGTLTSPFILVFGPIAGYYAGKSVHRKVVVSKVKQRLLKDGDMRSVLRRWNERTFMGKGFQAWLELPVDGNELPMDSVKGENKKRSEKKAAKKESRRFKIVIIPNSTREAYSWTSSSTPAETSIVEAPTTELESPVEMQGGSSTDVQPQGSHQVPISPTEDIKYEYRPVSQEIRPDHDDTSEAEISVANGREPSEPLRSYSTKKEPQPAFPTPTLEEELKFKDVPATHPRIFELESSQTKQILSAKQLEHGLGSDLKEDRSKD